MRSASSSTEVKNEIILKVNVGLSENGNATEISSITQDENTESQKDAWDGQGLDLVWDEGFQVKPYRVKIKYRDAEGQETTRNVQIDKIASGPNPGEASFRGYCELRKANRYFRGSRVSSMLDSSTGEVLEGSMANAFLLDHLNKQHSFRIDQFLLDETSSATLDCLMFVAKADGRMTREENEIIISWIQSTALEEPIDETGRAYIGRRIKDTSVSLAKFRRSRNIAKRNNRINSVIELAQAITNTRKSPSAQNEAAMLELRK